MMRRQREAKPVWDPAIGGFRLQEPPPVRRPDTIEEKRATQRATVTHLLAESFGLPLARRTTGVQVPQHLRQYVDRTGSNPGVKPAK